MVLLTMSNNFCLPNYYHILLEKIISEILSLRLFYIIALNKVLYLQTMYLAFFLPGHLGI